MHPDPSVSPVFEAMEHALDHCSAGYFGTKHPERDVARFVEVDVIFEWHLAVLAKRDAGGCFCRVQPVAQMTRVIATIRDDGATFGDIRRIRQETVH